MKFPSDCPAPDFFALCNRIAPEPPEGGHLPILGPKLLIIDEIGYLPFGREEANLFF